MQLPYAFAPLEAPVVAFERRHFERGSYAAVYNGSDTSCKSDGHDADGQARNLGRPPSLPAKSGADEPQHEFVYRHLGTKYDRVARVLAMAQEIPLRGEPESRRLDLPPQRRFFNAMQGFRDAYACPRLSRMVGDHQHTARFQRLEQRTIHLCAVDAHERRVVIGEKERDQIEIAHARWNWIVIVSQHAHDVPHRRRLRTLVEALVRSRRNPRRVLGIHRSAGTDRAG